MLAHVFAVKRMTGRICAVLFNSTPKELSSTLSYLLAV